eukprot:CAMPEP_0172863600 /NCGR_PEP_ID=MMETSP1075-20121228/77801_1 /TAXON_ID=2916 /ORGANISM="Ceratium fusus, Strain PA161109" /LENGTH=56 /DNA_ID=CAMNT_0013712259 /DNA_START=188 /DNA_END=355 /DNA_ORIENTATION=-
MNSQAGGASRAGSATEVTAAAAAAAVADGAQALPLFHVQQLLQSCSCNLLWPRTQS